MRDKLRIAELLLKLEACSHQCPEKTFEDLCRSDRNLRAELGRRPRLREWLERQLDKLRRVDQLIAPTVSQAMPQEFTGYELLEQVGRGGMGVVYRARHVDLNRTVALKVLLAGRFGSQKLLARFRAEAEAIARLSHPGVVQIYEMGETGGVPFLALEYVPGKSFKQRLGGKPIEPRAAAAWVAKIARAVEHAHQQGIVHRDLKPSNVLVTLSGEPKITDFGLVKYLEQDPGLTHTDETPGTPSYMAPEQLGGGGIGPATDVYALGAMLYECLTGRPPFVGTTSGETLSQVLCREPVAPTRLQPGVPRELEAVCLRCLEKKPASRYASAAELADDLERWMCGKATRAKPAGPAVLLWKGVRRHPTLAGLIAVSVLATCAIAGITVDYTQHLHRSRETAERLRAEAENSRTLAQQQAYASKIRTVQWAWDTCNRRAFADLLASFRQRSLRGFEWGYIERLAHRGQQRLHAQMPVEVDGIAMRPDCCEVATANRNGTIEIWSYPGCQRRKSFRAHQECVNLVRYSPDGRLLATASCDATIRLWDAETLELIREFRSPGGPVRTFLFSPLGEKIFSAGDEPLVRVWMVATGEPSARFRAEPGTSDALRSLAINQDGSILAASSYGAFALLWNTETGARLQRISKIVGDSPIQFVDGGASLAIAEGPYVRIVSVHDGQTQQTVPTHGPVNALAARLGSNALYCVTDSGVVDVVDPTLGVATGFIPLHRERITDVGLSPDGALLMTSSHDRTSVVLDLNESNGLKPFERLALPAGEVRSVAVSQRVSKLAVALDDGQRNNVVVREVGVEGSQTRLPRRASWPVDRMHFTFDGRYLTLINDHSNSSERWRISGGQPVLTQVGAEIQPLESPQPRDSWVLTPNGDELCVIDTRDGSVIGGFPVEHGATSFQFLPGDRWIAYRLPGEVRVRSLVEQHLLGSFRVSSDILDMDLSRDGSLLAVTSNAGVHLFAFPEGPMIHYLVGHTGGVYSVAFSPDSKTLATGGADQTIRLWNVATGQEMLTLRGHSTIVTGLAFSKDGTTLMSKARNSLTETPIELFRWRADPFAQPRNQFDDPHVGNSDLNNY